MGGEQLVRLLWEYYRKAAEIRGRGAERQAEDGRMYRPQSNYSLLWFYVRRPELLNGLTRAFLGDGEAMDALDWNAAPPEGWEAFLLEGRPLNECQLEAVRTALAAPLSFIQGPPGTGKTETILNLACCAARLDGGRSVAIVSTNGSALDNIQEKIGEIRAELERPGGGVRPNRRWLERHFARLGNAGIRRSFQDPYPEEGREFRFSGGTVKVPWTGEAGEVLEVLSVNREQTLRAEDFLAKYPIVASTIHSLKNCFRNGPEYLYDYVVMDESSQTDAVAGLVAMSCAKHLVLVGDPKQLPPVIPEVFVQELAEAAAERGWEIPPEHAAAPERSFLDACLDVFGERTARTTLKYHYRCHPGIIGFCARHVYQEEGLEIRTPSWDRSVRVPIRALWFEGDYCELCRLQAKGGEAGARGRWSKHNRKQLLCFMEEEWPQLWRRIRASESEDRRPLSVCILSPFKGQLADLQRAILEDIEARHQSAAELELALEDGGLPQGAEEPPMLTIHKAQGREFDIVYLLPVEDADWEWPWSQQKRLINVAVSRAKKELRLVLSSVLMEREMQEELTGRPVPPRCGNAAPGEELDQRFLQKLVRYVREEYRAQEEGEIAGCPGVPAEFPFGFHRSSRMSVFDKEPWFRASLAEAPGSRRAAWSPELCMETALVRVLEEFWTRRGVRLSLLRDVPLRDIRDGSGRPAVPPEGEEHMRELVRHSGHLDFVLCLEDRILLAVEVDGAYHRLPGEEGAAQRSRDEVKNRLLREVMGADCFTGNAAGAGRGGGGSFAFLRLSDDGGACLETRELWRQGTAEQKARYFPLEDLLDAQLDREAGSAAYYIPVKSISALAYGWRDPKGDKGRAVRAGQRLMEAGLIARQPCLSLAGQPLSAAPTAKGWGQGIIRAVQLSVRTKKNGEEECAPYGNALYPKSAQRKALKLLNGYATLTADMTAYELLDAVYGFLRGRLQKRETVEARRRALAELSRGMDYGRAEFQALYLLRYLYSHAYEYKRMYGDLLDRGNWAGGRLSVTSIGCGSMVDYWALRAAMRLRPGAVSGVDYTGVDLNGWSEGFQIHPGLWDSVEFVRADGAVWLREQAASGAPASDVYVFPKCVGEFDGGEAGGPVLRGVRDGLRELLGASGRDWVWLLISLDKDGGPSDEEKCACLREGLAQAGFRAAGPAGLFITDAESRSIRAADPSFSYPRKILRDLGEYGGYEGGWEPVLNTGCERYQALMFRREG